jgi:hypothetical protein
VFRHLQLKFPLNEKELIFEPIYKKDEDGTIYLALKSDLGFSYPNPKNQIIEKLEKFVPQKNNILNQQNKYHKVFFFSK